MKRKTIKKRAWLNSTSKDCQAACFWHVQIDPMWDKTQHPDEYHMYAEFGVNDEAKSHYIDRKEELRPLYKLQAELNRFIMECEAALLQVKEYNADVRSKT